MTILNSRQMPKKIEVTSDKKYSDVVYGWLQANSEWDHIPGHPRYIDKKDVKYVEIGQALGISRQTASTKFRNLISMGLVSYNEEEKVYELTIMDKDMAWLIENNTLRKLISALNENAINMYIYLAKRYFGNNCAPYSVSYSQIKHFIGMSEKTRSNDYVIKDILEILEKLGLVSYYYKKNSSGEEAFKSTLVVTKVAASIDKSHM